MTNGIEYSHWKKEHEPLLRDFSHKKIFFLFSAGKDSSLAMHFMLKAGKEFGFRFEAHTGAFPMHRYTAGEKERITSYWKERGIVPVWHAPEETDAVLEKIDLPCLECQLIRKRMLLDFFKKQSKEWRDLIIVTSYSLWDLVSYAVEQMLINLLGEMTEEQHQANQRRKIETMQRFQPILKMKEGYTVFRPLVRYNGIDIEREIQKNQIPILSIPCRFADQRPKRILDRYYKKFGTGFDYEKLMRFVRQCELFPESSALNAMVSDEYFGKYF